VITGEIADDLLDPGMREEKLMADRKRLLSVVQYFRSEECRRVFISRYFGFSDEQPCGNCDTCDQVTQEREEEQ